jgi:hypothetical protein
MSFAGKSQSPKAFPPDSDFAGMMRPGHNQSTPFGLSAAGCISTALDFGRAKLPLCLGRNTGERRGTSDRTGNKIALLVFVEVWASRQQRPTYGSG